MTDLTDSQWCALDLLARAKAKGADRDNRLELLHRSPLPDGAKVKIVFALLTMPAELVTLHGQHDFEITDEGIRVQAEKFGQPSAVADHVILLPDRSGETIQ
jgi:hypothetical protein